MKSVIQGLFLLMILMIPGCTGREESKATRILILSGRNNHEWEKTTPLLARILTGSGNFTVSITDKPDTLKYNDLERFDAVVSNWNSWPDTVSRFSQQWEENFEKFISKGGGAVFLHAGASSFYGWEKYHQIGIGRWGPRTHHGQQTLGKITGFDEKHPVTAAFTSFYIFDELWEKTDIARGAKVLASVEATDPSDGHPIREGIVFSNQNGKGKSIYIAAGHDEKAMLNHGFRALFLRSVQWTAGRDVNISPPADILKNVKPEPDSLFWLQSDTTFSLSDKNGALWQFNYNDRYLRPYFHPLTVKKSTLTCLSPPDHPWHLGLWFCWKFINGVNYWEYTEDHKSPETGFRSAGVTNITGIKITKNKDFSAEINLKLSYFPQDSTEVLSELRKITVSAPYSDGSYYIDHESLFTAGEKDVVLGRTPIEGEPGGVSWGGYAGLSVRFSQDYSNAFVLAPDTSGSYRKNPWVYMGFNTLKGDTAGICIMRDLKKTSSETSWYIINTPSVPFFYYSPAALFDGNIKLPGGQSLSLGYRCWIVAGKPGESMLSNRYAEFSEKNNPNNLTR